MYLCHPLPPLSLLFNAFCRISTFLHRHLTHCHRHLTFFCRTLVIPNELGSLYLFSLHSDASPSPFGSFCFFLARFSRLITFSVAVPCLSSAFNASSSLPCANLNVTSTIIWQIYLHQKMIKTRLRIRGIVKG